MFDSEGHFPSVIPGMVLGNYRIERLIGEGGMGAVFLGRHRTLNRSVAIKTLHGHLARQPELRQRFVYEGQAAAAIAHPNVVEVFDVGELEELPYLVMEYLEGQTLRAYVSEDLPLAETQLADFILPAVAAVAAAHDRRIVHRDLKTDNIFIAEAPGGRIPKVLDFGISKVLDPTRISDLTDTSAFLGTPSYMAPEQTQSVKAASPKSDQFSMGVIVYELATGRKPFSGQSLLSLLESIRACRFELPHRHRSDLSAQLEGVILRCMQLDPDDRYDDLRELGNALLPLCSERVRQMYAPELLGVGNVTLLSAQKKEKPTRLVLSSPEGTLVAASANPHKASSRKRRLAKQPIWATVGIGLAVAWAGFSGWRYQEKVRDSSVGEQPSVAAARAHPALPRALPKTESPAGPAARDKQRHTGTSGRPEGATDAPATGALPMTFQLRSSPVAQVFGAGGVRLGQTPLEVALPLEGRPVRLVLRAPGHAARTVRLAYGERPPQTPIVLRPEPTTARNAEEVWELAPR